MSFMWVDVFHLLAIISIWIFPVLIFSKMDHEHLVISIIRSIMLLVSGVALLSLTPGIDYFTTNELAIILSFIMSVLSLIAIRKLKVTNSLFFSETLTTIILLFAIIFLVYTTHGPEIRFHQSPDNHGFAATVGNFLGNFSHKTLSENFSDVTGLVNPAFTGLATPNLASAWNIPDVQLRYTSDMVFAVGRFGFPVLFATLASLGDAETIFLTSMLLFGVLGCIGISAIYVDSFERIMRAFCAHKSMSVLTRSSLISLFSLTGWPILLAYEGALNQLWASLAILMNVYSISIWLNSKERHNLVSYVSILTAPLFISIVYPHILPLVFLSTILSIVVLVSFSGQLKSIFSIKYIQALLTILMGIPLALVSLGHTYLNLILGFINNKAGAPFNLHISSTWQYFQGLPLSLWPSDRGFYNYFNSIDNAKIALYITLLISVLLVFTSILRKKINPLLGVTLVGTTVVLCAPIFLLLQSPQINPYVLSRHYINLSLFGWPIIIFLSAINVNITNKNYKLRNFSIVLLTMVSAIWFVYFSNSFKQNSIPMRIFANVESKNDFKKINRTTSIFVSDTPLHEFSFLTLTGQLYYLTDNWGPNFKVAKFNSDKIDVYNLELNSNILSYTKVGVLDESFELSGPLSNLELYENKLFIPN